MANSDAGLDCQPQNFRCQEYSTLGSYFKVLEVTSFYISNGRS